MKVLVDNVVPIAAYTGGMSHSCSSSIHDFIIFLIEYIKGTENGVTIKFGFSVAGDDFYFPVDTAGAEEEYPFTASSQFIIKVPAYASKVKPYYKLTGGLADANTNLSIKIV